MSTVKKEARLSSLLLARKGAAAPSHTDHRFTRQAFDQFETYSQDRMLSDVHQEGVSQDEDVNSHELNGVIAEIKTLKAKQTNIGSKQIKSTKIKKTAAHKNVSGKRIAMTLRMAQENHLKLRLYAAYSRKSCQEIISEALDYYLNKSEDVGVENKYKYQVKR